MSGPKAATLGEPMGLAMVSCLCFASSTLRQDTLTKEAVSATAASQCIWSRGIPDILDFLELRKNHGDEETKARDLFYALWVPDLFMKRVKENGSWSLFCPDQCPGLAEVYGAEFEALYTKYEREGKARKTMEARKLFFAVLESQMETGTPYLLYKDAANTKSNQKNLGTTLSQQFVHRDY